MIDSSQSCRASPKVSGHPEGRLFGRHGGRAQICAGVVPTFLHGADGAARVLSRALSAFSPLVAHTRFDLPPRVALLRNADLEVIHSEPFPGVFPIGYTIARRRL